jgi:hypothetical protein
MSVIEQNIIFLIQFIKYMPYLKIVNNWRPSRDLYFMLYIEKTKKNYFVLQTEKGLYLIDMNQI